MLFIDKILLSPIYGIIWVARQVDHAIKQDREAEPERIRTELSELYMSLDTGRITESEFDAREAELLDQLDRLEAKESGATEEDDKAENDVLVESPKPQPPAASQNHDTK